MTPKPPLCPTAQILLRPLWQQKIDGKHTVNNENGCWEWTGKTDSKGYGAIWFRAGGRRRIAGAHRASWVVHRGPIVGNLDIDHLCMNKICVNPEHLEPVTHRENMRRAYVAGLLKGKPWLSLAERQGCQRHGFADGKWYERKSRKNGGMDWSCRICGRERQRAARAQKRAA